MDRVDRRAWATRVAPAWLLWLLYAAAVAVAVAVAVVVGIGQRWLVSSSIESNPNEPPAAGLYRLIDLLGSGVSLVATLLLSFALLGAALLAIGSTGAGGWLLLQLQEPRTEAQMRAYIGSHGMAQLAYGVLGIALTWGFWSVAHRGVPALPDPALGASDIEAASEVDAAAGPSAQPHTAPPATATEPPAADGGIAAADPHAAYRRPDR